jgi:hypothetical protein
MRNNLISFSGTELMTVGAAYGAGIYFSQSVQTAGGYAHASSHYDSAPMFVLEAAGELQNWEKTSQICTSLFPAKYHASVRKGSSRPSPHAVLVIRGVFMDSSRSGSPSTSHESRAYFERAQAAYAAAVDAQEWGKVRSSLLDVVSPKQGLGCSAVHQ